MVGGDCVLLQSCFHQLETTLLRVSSNRMSAKKEASLNDITNESPSGRRTPRRRSNRIVFEEESEEETQVNKKKEVRADEKKTQKGKKKTQMGKKNTQAAFVEQMQPHGAVPSRMKLLTGITVTPCRADGTPLLRHC